MTPTQPSRTQQAIYRFVMQHAPVSREATLTPYTFAGAVSDQYLTATARLHGSKQAFLTLAFPQLSSKVFIAVTDDYPESFAELAASSGAESESNDALAIGHAEPLDSPLLSQFGWDAVLMTSPSQILKGFPDAALIGQENYEFVLLTLITKQELLHWRKAGYDSLMHKFGAQKRDLLRFHQKTVGCAQIAIHPKSAQRNLGRNKAMPPQTASQKPQQTSNTGTKHPAAQASATSAAQIKIPTQTQLPSHQMPLQKKTVARSTQPGVSAHSLPNLEANPNSLPSMALDYALYATQLNQPQRKQPTPLEQQRPVAPAFPFAEPHGENEQYATPDNWDKNPLRINLGIEPSQAFITGKAESLPVGRIPPNIPERSSRKGQSHHTDRQTGLTSSSPQAAHLYTAHNHHTSHNHAGQKKRVSLQNDLPKPTPVHDTNQDLGLAFEGVAVETITDADYHQNLSRGTPTKPAQFRPRSLSHPSASRSGVVSKRMHSPPRGGRINADPTFASHAPARKQQANSERTKSSLTQNSSASSKSSEKRNRQLSSLDDAITDQWASSIVALSRQQQAEQSKFNTSDADHTSLFELGHASHRGPRTKWQLLSETALGTLLLVGGLFTMLFFVDTQIPTASVIPGIFAVAGIVTLTSAFKDALRLERAEQGRT